MEQLKLFEMEEAAPAQPVFRPFNHPVWTENKARLIARYLFLFVMVTKHGLYIDGFAAPQEPDLADSWSAKLVLESVPRQFLREFWLCEENPNRAQYLRDLVARQPPTKPPQRFRVLQGDFNETYREILTSGRITRGKATFCLLDQWTFECKWDTVRALANHKTEGNKVELFYFLATGWLDRSLAALTANPQKATEWWGDESWRDLQGMDGTRRAFLMCDRFRKEFGYKFVSPFPIYKRGKDGAVMYHMIHASDHPEAPKFMARAYRTATQAVLPSQQLEIEFADFDQVSGDLEVDLSGSPTDN